MSQTPPCTGGGSQIHLAIRHPLSVAFNGNSGAWQPTALECDAPNVQVLLGNQPGEYRGVAGQERGRQAGTARGPVAGHASMRGPLSSATGADSVSQASRTSPSPSASV